VTVIARNVTPTGFYGQGFHDELFLRAFMGFFQHFFVPFSFKKYSKKDPKKPQKRLKKLVVKHPNTKHLSTLFPVPAATN
jgi:hypothetical protein